MQCREEKIRRRAYELWEQAGHTGSAEEHWLRAERETSDDQQSTDLARDNTRNAEILDAWVMGHETVLVGPTRLRGSSQTTTTTGAGPVSRACNSLLEFMNSAPRGWPWRLSPSRS